MRRVSRFRERGGSGLRQWLARRELRTAAELYVRFCAPLGGVTLDLGAGGGTIWRLVPELPKLICLDIAGLPIHPPFVPPFVAPESGGEGDCLPQLSLAVAKTHRAFHRLIADAARPPLRNQAVTSIVALGLLEYLGDLEAIFSNWRNVCRTGGRMLVSNSPPTLPNRTRQWLGLGAKPRPDYEVITALGRCGWLVLEGSLRKAGWQTLLVAEARPAF